MALFYFFAIKQSRQANYLFFRHRLGYSSLKAYWHCYKKNYIYGQTLIDKVAITIGMTKTYTFEFDGKHHIEKLLNDKKGGIFFTAHIGNFNVARYFFKEIGSDTKVNLVVTDMEHADIKAYFEAISVKSSIDFIVLKEDMSHAIPMSNAIKNKEVLIFASDRYLEGVPTVAQEFFDKEVQFPEGPFKLAIRYKLPVLFVHCMREPNRHYHLSARPVHQDVRTVPQLVSAYSENLESMVKKYPMQWFNFYDYWDDRL